MALGGAWATALVNRSVVHLSGRTFGALGDAAIIGLFGDAGADVQLPAGFQGTVGDGQGIPTAAQLFDRITAVVNAESDPSSAAGVDLWQVLKSSVAPFRVTLTLRGSAAPTAPVAADVNLRYDPAGV